MTNQEPTRVYVDRDLLKETKNVYPETKGMTFSGLVDWALRKLLQQGKEAS